DPLASIGSRFIFIPLASSKALILHPRQTRGTGGEMVAGKRIGFLGVAVTCLALWPALASAQSGIAGAVRDTSGAVLPGVTVEASSPALIEKSRSVQTDNQGRYSIVDIRPGVYTVTFVLPGFSTVKREGLEVQSNTTLPLNAELRVGSLEETVTVT